MTRNDMEPTCELCEEVAECEESQAGGAAPHRGVATHGSVLMGGVAVVCPRESESKAGAGRARAGLRLRLGAGSPCVRAGRGTGRRQRPRGLRGARSRASACPRKPAGRPGRPAGRAGGGRDATGAGAKLARSWLAQSPGRVCLWPGGSAVCSSSSARLGAQASQTRGDAVRPWAGWLAGLWLAGWQLAHQLPSKQAAAPTPHPAARPMARSPLTLIRLHAK